MATNKTKRGRRRRPSVELTRLPGLPAEVLLLLDVDVAHLDECCDVILAALRDKDIAGDEGHAAEIERVLRIHGDGGPDVLSHSVAIVHEQLHTAGPDVQVLVRFAKPSLDLIDPDGHPTHFLWVLLSSRSTHPHVDSAAEFADLMGEDAFSAAAIAADTADDLRAAYAEALDNRLHFRLRIPPELQRTGRIGGGVIADIKRRFPSYKSDIADGLNSKSLASTFFLYFACIAPAIAFGGLLSVLTEGQIGAVEMIVATAIAGITYALLSGQPLTILGSTGPVIIFIGILFSLCKRYDLPFMETLACVGLWTALFLVILSLIDACSFIRYFTRFTDETFAALISVIFIYEALKDVALNFANPKVSHDTALLSMVLAGGTFMVAMSLSRLRQSRYLLRPVREFLADFGPTIAIFGMSAVAVLLHEVDLETLKVPTTLSTSSGRPWLVNPLAVPGWVIGASAVPALLVSVLLYLDQNITVRLVNARQHNLKKGVGYNLDMMVVGLLVAACSMLGLPWMVAATVRSLNHVRSLATTESHEGQERIIDVKEQRVTGLAVHGLVAVSLAFLSLLKLVPLCVLFGLFLFMGVASMSGNQLFERLRLWIMDPSLYPPTYYLRAVPRGQVHKFTFIQLVCLVILWVIKASALGIIFPLFIGLLVPLRMILERWFKPEHLALLDAEETPEDEEDRATLL